jgi:DNA-binding CsgD family transcriptional regulator
MADTSNDEAAILALLQRERRASQTGDFEGSSENHVHSDYAVRWHASRMNGILALRGWDEIEPRMRSFAADRRQDPRPADDGAVEDLRIRIHGDMAWLSYIRRYPESREHRASPEPGHHVRVLERHNGEWKFVFFGFLDPGPGSSGLLRIRLAADGSVLWVDAAAHEALDSDDDLVIRAGKLRLRDLRAQQRLVAAIAWAAGLDHVWFPARGAMPLVLERGEGLSARVLWVLAENGGIYLVAGDPSRDVQRLDAAGAVYGLSKAQRVVAGLLVEGMPVPEIARTMGVRPATVRTHLERMFVKTGVHNQTALVRVLLSVAAPL